jgi:hypothetical protein
LARFWQRRVWPGVERFCRARTKIWWAMSGIVCKSNSLTTPLPFRGGAVRLASLLASRNGVGRFSPCATLTVSNPTQLAPRPRPGDETGQLLKGGGLAR